MFGVSFLEIALVGLVALLVVGPQKLPAMMRTAGEWVGKIRRMTADMRAQTGIDDILREEGIDGVRELRTLLKGERAMAARRSAVPSQRTYDVYSADPDPAIEFPVEGPDAQGALPDDLIEDPEADGAEAESAPSEAEASAATLQAVPPDAQLDAGSADSAGVEQAGPAAEAVNKPSAFEVAAAKSSTPAPTLEKSAEVVAEEGVSGDSDESAEAKPEARAAQSTISTEAPPTESPPPVETAPPPSVRPPPPSASRPSASRPPPPSAGPTGAPSKSQPSPSRPPSPPKSAPSASRPPPSSPQSAPPLPRPRSAPPVISDKTESIPPPPATPRLSPPRAVTLRETPKSKAPVEPKVTGSERPVRPRSTPPEKGDPS